MAKGKNKKSVTSKYEWTKDWILHNPEDWVILLVALVGFANLAPNVYIPQLDIVWPILITAIFLYKLGKRKYPIK
jgi:hypothetical protein